MKTFKNSNFNLYKLLLGIHVNSFNNKVVFFIDYNCNNVLEINLNKQTKGKVKTVSQGVKSTKAWHKENPHKYKTKFSSKKK